MDALEKREKYMRKPYKYISKTSAIMSDCHYSESKQYHSVQFNSVTLMSDSLRPHGPQLARLAFSRIVYKWDCVYSDLFGAGFKSALTP